MSKLTVHKRRSRRQRALKVREADVVKYEASNDNQRKLDKAKADVLALYKKLGLSGLSSVKV